ncbi:hypothetical protein SDA16_06940 [Legionella pneumophila serogroup 1]|uniref:Uncharacterized protein n=1 Tax=Legionella pneumophila TaxID=446 RepID=A0A140AYM4_LEGPN|nr:hypothetical protein [Legionella pneumophila]HCC3235840.1 hypothetical protein [Legionella pneumophila subsp. pneumophila]ALK43921.1 hypothetical protein [Legionella pneumophila]HAT2149822.1 hypothetical protein [Legionella pneumophila]HAT8621022.1 hypothetical protein [Legionella pneumophila]HAT8730852.1 hypothetical protein [Legionella pneumophila]
MRNITIEDNEYLILHGLLCSSIEHTTNQIKDISKEKIFNDLSDEGKKRIAEFYLKMFLETNVLLKKLINSQQV